MEIQNGGIDMTKIIRVDGCHLCPFYERYEGRVNVYHTCRHSQKTVKNDFTILFRFCELQDEEDLK